MQISWYTEFFSVGDARTADKKIMRNTFIECVQGDASTSAAKRAPRMLYENCKKGWVGSINIWTANEFTFHNCLFIKHKFVRKAQLSGTYFDWCWLNANIEAAAWRCCCRRRWMSASEREMPQPERVCDDIMNACAWCMQRAVQSTRSEFIRCHNTHMYALSR